MTTILNDGLPTVRKSKSARKDGNRNTKKKDKNNYLVIFFQPNGAYKMMLDHISPDVLSNTTGVHIRNNKPAVEEWDTLTDWTLKRLWAEDGLQRYSRALFSNDTFESLVGQAEEEFLYEPSSRFGGHLINLPGYVRTFWGKKWYPELVKFWNEDHKCHTFVLVVFDPAQDFKIPMCDTQTEEY